MLRHTMTHRLVVFGFVCLWQIRCSFSNTIPVVVIGQEASFDNDTLSASYLLPKNSTNNSPNFHFTVLEGQGESYQNILETFCAVVKSVGVSVVISQSFSSHPRLIDIFASYVGFPVMKLFHNINEPSVVEQAQRNVLHIDPDPSTQHAIIVEMLKEYNRNDRVVVISRYKQPQWGSNLVTMLRSTSNSVNDVILDLCISDERDENYFRILSALSVLNVKAVVLALDQNLALDFLNAAREYGFQDVDCLWILQHPLDDYKNEQIPLLGKLLSISFTQSGFKDNRLGSRQESLLKDSIRILKKAFQSRISATFENFSTQNDCNSTNPLPSGTSLYRTMKLVQLEGDTGWIEFDDQGYRKNVAYDINYWYKDGNGSAAKVLLAESRNSKLKILLTGWPPVWKKDILEWKLAENKPLKISVLLQEPYVLISGTSDSLGCAFGLPCEGIDGKHSCCTGYCIDLLKLLMRDIGFSVKIQVVKDGKYGAFNRTAEQWSGLIGEVVRGEADMAVSDLTINEQRSKVVDFTHPYMDAGMAVIVKVHHREKNNWTGFMDPFAANLWIALVVCVNITLFFMWLLERYSPYGRLERGKTTVRGTKKRSFGLVQATWFTWSLVFQTFDVGTRPKSFSCRILALGFAFSMLIVITSYTANLAAFLVVVEEILPLGDSGIRDLKLQNPPGGFKIATVQESSFERFFQATDDPMLSRVWQHMKHNSVKNFEKAINQMNSGELQAFVSDYPTLENFAAKSRDCMFKIVGKSFFQSGFGFAVKKNSSLTVRLSQVLRQYEDYDIPRILRQRWFLGKCSDANHEEKAMFARLSIADLSGLFLAICVGVTISALFFSLEYFNNYIRSSLYTFRKRAQNQHNLDGQVNDKDTMHA